MSRFLPDTLFFVAVLILLIRCFANHDAWVIVAVALLVIGRVLAFIDTRRLLASLDARQNAPQPEVKKK